MSSIQNGWQRSVEAELTIRMNMLTLGVAKEAIDLYKSMFRIVLTNDWVRVLDIDMAGILPALVGALGLGAIVGELPGRAYDGIAMRLGSTTTYEQGRSLYWEVYGNPFQEIVHFVNVTLPTE